MRKPGVPLHVLPGFTDAIASRLRDHLSVSTADEFVDLATRFPEQVRQVADVSNDEWHRLVEVATTHVSPETLEEIVNPKTSDYPFKTGFDVPDDQGNRGRGGRGQT
jgi:hypothetical protein